MSRTTTLWIFHLSVTGIFMWSIWPLDLIHFLIAVITATLLESIDKPWEIVD